MTITGEQFNIETDHTYTVTIAKIACSINSITDTEIQCTLASELPAGKWIPKVIDSFGMVKLDSTVTPFEVAISITDISPKSSLNPAGGNIITITGTNLPNYTIYGMTITLDNQIKCVPISSTITEISCETEPIVTSRRRRLVSSTLKMGIRWTTDDGLMT